MNRFIIAAICILQFTGSINAQQILGGDITWTCLKSGGNAGKFVFRLTLFNQCDSGALPSSQVIKVYDGPVSTIPVVLQNEELISYPCYDTSKQISCTKTNTGAVTMGFYLSAPITLSGVPPAGGWKFTWSHCCRPTQSNLNGTHGYTLKSLMFPYQNQNTSTCFDDSQQFLGAPKSSICTGYLFYLNHRAYDPDLDVTTLSFDQPLDSSSSWPAGPVVFKTGYSASSPFPGTTHHANNVPAQILPISGDIAFTSHTTERIFHSLKVESRRNGTLVSTVSRDYSAALVSCPPSPTIPPLSNTPPNIVIKDTFSSPNSYPLPAQKSVYAGETVEFVLVSTDIQFLPGFIGQSNRMKAYGSQFGTGYGDSLAGCNAPPCAVLDTASAYFEQSTKTYYNQFGITTNFLWKTDSTHGSQAGTVHRFHFNVSDDWCPNPGLNEQTFSVIVYDHPPNHITGTVFIDSNGNGIKDGMEPGRSKLLVKLSPQDYYQSTDVNGFYSLTTFQDTNSVSIIIPQYYQITSPPTGLHTVIASGSGNTYSGKNFGIKPIPNINDLTIDLNGWGIMQPGYITNYNLYYKNVGTTTISGNVEMTFDSNLFFQSAVPTPSSATGNLIKWNYTALQPNQSKSVSISFLVDSNAAINTPVKSYVSIYPLNGDSTPANNIDSFYNIVLNSFDPNRKLARPDAYYNEDGKWVLLNEVRKGKFIEYGIDFQNTGNAPAVNVLLKDSLEAYLDLESFEFLGSSHAGSFEIKGRQLFVYFNNINLPPSSSHPYASMGYAKFRIMADTSLNENDSIRNTARIYFDNNIPVRAPSAVGIIDTVIQIISVQSIGNEAPEVYIFPNPSNGQFSISLSSDRNEKVQYNVYDLKGIHLASGQFRSGTEGHVTTKVDLNMAGSGMYFVRITGSQFSIVRRIVIQ